MLEGVRSEVAAKHFAFKSRADERHVQKITMAQKQLHHLPDMEFKSHGHLNHIHLDKMTLTRAGNRGNSSWSV